MFTRKALNDRINAFLTDLQTIGFPVEKAVLFGSYASGKPHEHSDIDLAVWMKKPLQKHYTEISELLHIVAKHHPIKPQFYDCGETSEDDPFIEVIEKTGELIKLPAHTTNLQ